MLPEAAVGVGVGDLWTWAKGWFRRRTNDGRVAITLDEIRQDDAAVVAEGVLKTAADLKGLRAECDEAFRALRTGQEAGRERHERILEELVSLRHEVAGLDEESERTILEKGLRASRGRGSPESRRLILRATARQWDPRLGMDALVRQEWFGIIEKLPEMALAVILKLGPRGRLLRHEAGGNKLLLMKESDYRQLNQMISAAEDEAMGREPPNLAAVGRGWLGRLENLTPGFGDHYAVQTAIGKMQSSKGPHLVETIGPANHYPPLSKLKELDIVGYQLNDYGREVYKYIRPYDE